MRCSSQLPVPLVEFGMGGDKDGAHTVYVAGDAYLETEVAFRGLAQNSTLSGHADRFESLRRWSDFLSGMWFSLQRVYNRLWRETRQSQALVGPFFAAFVETGGATIG